MTGKTPPTIEKKSCIIAEKPSMGRDIAKALGVTQKGEGYLYNDTYIITWAFGHLLSTMEPQEMNPAWSTWRSQDLPLIPSSWPLKVNPSSPKQFEIIKNLVLSPGVSDIINAMDAGREGELIFRQLYHATRCTKPVRRLWLSALTPESIQSAIEAMKPGGAYNNLATAAICRSRADWLVGINLTRACTLAHNELFTIGRVQTPTLNLVVLRDHEISSFVPADYFLLKLTCQPNADPDATFQTQVLSSDKTPPEVIKTLKKGRSPKLSFLSQWGHFDQKDTVEKLSKQLNSGSETLKLIGSTGRTNKQSPDNLLSLTDLQRKANQLFGFSASETLEIAQRLYEQFKIISYPRTNSSFLSSGVLAEVPKIRKNLELPYQRIFSYLSPELKVPEKFIDDEDASEHHALIPTIKPCEWTKLPEKERKIYDLICRSFLCIWGSAKITQISEAYFTVSSPDSPPADQKALDLFCCAKGRQILDHGFERILSFAPWGHPESSKQNEKTHGKDIEPKGSDQVLPSFFPDDIYPVREAKISSLKTLPPAHYSDATLLAAMERAGRHLKKDTLLKGSMRDFSLGTAATRSQIIESLVKRAYIVRKGRQIYATEKAYTLISAISERIKSPEITGKWEAELESIYRGTLLGKQFMNDITIMVREEVAAFGTSTSLRHRSEPSFNSGPGKTSFALPKNNLRDPQAIKQQTQDDHDTLAREKQNFLPPLSQKSLKDILKLVWNYASFRPLQEQACCALLNKKNVLMVMPTGAGKSLCYQLPGLKMGKLTLVISPLISLMEDQCKKLLSLGLRAFALHSGMSAERSKLIWQKLSQGQIDFLYVSPERLSSEFFCREVFSQNISLIAIDEAHCISHWGHDFRPEYRVIGDQLHRWAQSIPIIALTATATAQVQDDIVAQLKIIDPEKIISGFFRSNLAITPMETARDQRIKTIRTILKKPESLPAIIFASSRKEAEKIHLKLSSALDCDGGLYHAGLDPEVRHKTQDAFLAGRLSFIVATIAFGMGIDKPDIRTVIHANLPRNLEGYYQEIGRAGRDGLNAKAILLWSYQDLNHHEYFLGKLRDSLVELDALFKKIPHSDSANTFVIETPSTFQNSFGPEDSSQRLLLMLQNLGGITGNIRTGFKRASSEWRTTFLAHLEMKEISLSRVIKFLNSDMCRMQALCEYFGENTTSQCGHCDICQLTKTKRHSLSATEKKVAMHLFDSLKISRERSLGKLYNDLCGDSPLSKSDFEVLLSALFKSRMIAIEYRSFLKDKHRIEYQVACIEKSISKKSFKQKLEAVHLQKFL